MEYELLVREFQAYLSRQGIQKPAFTRNGLETFSSFPEYDQRRYVSQLRNYLDICLGAERENLDSLRDPRSVLNYVSFRLQIRIPEDFLDKICATDIVEVFDYQGTQLYRNLTFFEISDYTIDDFFGRTWDYLYERSSRVTKKIFERVAATAEVLQCIPFDVPEHYMRERYTENRKIVKVNLKYLAPLLRDGNPIAWIALSSASEVLAKTEFDVNAMEFI